MSAPDEAIVDAIASRGTRWLLLLLDFDGTLSEFQVDPAAVRILPGAREAIVTLAARPRTSVAIVSGRRAEDVRARAELPDGVMYAGFHGFEIETPDESFLHPAAAAAVPILRELREGLAPRLAPLPGVFIEDKGLSIALHDRDADDRARRDAEALFTAAVEPHVRAGRLRALRGDRVIELLPPADWNKGSAVRWLRDRAVRAHGPVLPVYIGDDVTDEDAFRAIADDGISIASSARVTGAQFRVDGPRGVERLLRALVMRNA